MPYYSGYKELHKWNLKSLPLAQILQPAMLDIEFVQAAVSK